MITKRLLLAMVVVTTVIFALAYLAAQSYWLALLTFLLGTAWFALEVRDRQTLVSLFFLLFLSLAVYGSVQSFPAPIMLLGVCTTLAAWDLSRFHLRIKDETDTSAKASLESNHLRKLGLTIGAGLLLALIPMFIRLSLNFVILVGIVLTAMLVLRKSVLSLRGESGDKQNTH